MSAAGLPARRASLAALRAVEEDGAWSNRAVPAAIDGLEDARDRRFAAHLAYDTLRWEGTLDWALATVVARSLADVEPALRRILRLGAVQLLKTRVAPRAAVDTAAALARDAVPRTRATGATGFVNGVLRELARRIDALPWPDPATDPIDHLVLTTAHPAWIVVDLADRYPHERVAAILHADNQAPGVTLRVTAGRAEVLDELVAAGLDAVAGDLDEAIRVPGGDPRRMPVVEYGRAVPQDEASMHVVHATGAGPGDRVLDLCAGPGGKSTFLAAVVGPQGHVSAVELHPRRADLVREAASRQGVEVEVVVGDATRPPLPPDATYDVVLLDAPCTGLGTGRRRPEVRWRRTAEDAASLAALQDRLLASAAERVRPGGRLTYSVCTWTAVETVAVTDRFDAAVGDRFVRESRRLLLPDRDGTDGMFIATWRAIEPAGSSPLSQ